MLSTTSNIATYNGNGVTTAFSFPYYFIANSHLVVTLITIASSTRTPLVLGTDYTVTGAGNMGGGTVTTTATYSNLFQIEVKRVVPLQQLTNFVANDPFPAETMEQDLDYLTMIAQQLDYRLGVVEAGGGVTPLSIANLPGTGVPIYASQVGNTFNLKKLVGLSGVTITDAGTEVQLSLAGALVAANNLSDVTNQQTAIDNVSNVGSATANFVLTKDPGTGHAVWLAASAGISYPGNKRTILRGDSVFTLTFDGEASGTQAQLVMQDTGFAPGYLIKQLGANADARVWRITAPNQGGNSEFQLLAYNDAGSGGDAVMTVDRSGTTATLMQLMGAHGRVLVGNGADDTVTGFQVSASQSFIGSAARLLADTQNATLVNRFGFVDKTTNAITEFIVLPNGTATQAGARFYDNATPTNGDYLGILTNTTGHQINTAHSGSGTTRDMIFAVDGTAKARLLAAGRLTVAEPTDDGSSAFQVNGAAWLKNAWFTELDDGNSGTAITVDFTARQYHKVTLNGVTPVITMTPPTHDCVTHLTLVQDPTGSRVPTFSPVLKWDSRAAAADKTLTTAANAVDQIAIKWRGGAVYLAQLSKNPA